MWAHRESYDQNFRKNQLKLLAWMTKEEYVEEEGVEEMDLSILQSVNEYD